MQQRIMSNGGLTPNAYEVYAHLPSAPDSGSWQCDFSAS